MVEPKPPKAVLPKIQPLEVMTLREGVEFKYGPIVENGELFPKGLLFKPDDELPEGCRLSDRTGRLRWTPTEMHGPGKYSLRVVCSPRGDPARSIALKYELIVIEVNSPPELTIPERVSAQPGKSLTIPVTLHDGDFPSNAVEVRLGPNRPEGFRFDAVGKQLSWQVPADADAKELVVDVSAIDDGQPRLTTTRRLTIDVLPPVVVDPPMAVAPEERTPHVYIDLPELPRPRKTIERSGIPILVAGEGQSGENASQLKLSLLVPEPLKEKLSINYLGDGFDRFCVKVTHPFEAEAQENSPPEGAIAECSFDGSKLWWTWAYTMDQKVRGYQNNLRECVLAIESKNREDTLLVALRPPFKIPPVPLLEVLRDEKSQVTLHRHERVATATPLTPLDCTLKSDTWKLPLQGKMADGSCRLVNEELPERIGFSEFSFILQYGMDKVCLKLQSNPSLQSAREQLVTARRLMSAKAADMGKWQRKYSGAQTALSRAQSRAVRNAADQSLRDAQIATASRNMQNAASHISQLRIQIPQTQQLVVNSNAALQELLGRLQGVQGCVISGKLCRRVADVRVTVIEMGTAVRDDVARPHP